MINGIKCSRKVHEEEDGYGTSKEEIVSDFKEGSFSTVMTTESRLKCFEQLGGVKIWEYITEEERKCLQDFIDEFRHIQQIYRGSFALKANPVLDMKSPCWYLLTKCRGGRFVPGRCGH